MSTKVALLVALVLLGIDADARRFQHRMMEMPSEMEMREDNRAMDGARIDMQRMDMGRNMRMGGDMRKWPDDEAAIHANMRAMEKMRMDEAAMHANMRAMDQMAMGPMRMGPNDGFFRADPPPTPATPAPPPTLPTLAPLGGAAKPGKETGKPGQPGGSSGDGEKTKCSPIKKCLKNEDCGEKGSCIGVGMLASAVSKCSPLACVQGVACSAGGSTNLANCGNLEGACNSTTNTCDCKETFTKLGYKDSNDAFAKLSKVDCDGLNQKEKCHGLPCWESSCMCGLV